MTRISTSPPGPMPEAELPTSRHAAQREIGVLAALRGMAPRETLNPYQARVVAHRQAAHLLRLARLQAPPVPTDLIAHLPRIVVRADSQLPVSAATHWLNGRWLVLVNSREPLERQRFSLAHEYKHALDHRHVRLLYRDRAGMTAAAQAERAADEFAAALLMPAAWVRRAWRRGQCDVLTLARAFGVSDVAMRRRLTDLALIPTDQPGSAA